MSARHARPPQHRVPVEWIVVLIAGVITVVVAAIALQRAPSGGGAEPAGRAGTSGAVHTKAANGAAPKFVLHHPATGVGAVTVRVLPMLDRASSV